MEVLIADDHSIVRIGLSLIVNRTFKNAAISEAGNAAQVLYQVSNKKFDLILMDLKMPNTDSISLLQEVLQIDSKAKVVIVSLNQEEIYARHYLQTGAYGYVEKSSSDAVIQKAMETVASGKKYMSETIIQQMTDFRMNKESNNPFLTLSAKEMAVTTHLINGMGNTEICSLLQLQSSTVATYKKRIFEKTNVKTVYELQQLALSLGLS